MVEGAKTLVPLGTVSQPPDLQSLGLGRPGTDQAGGVPLDLTGHPALKLRSLSTSESGLSGQNPTPNQVDRRETEARPADEVWRETGAPRSGESQVWRPPDPGPGGPPSPHSSDRQRRLSIPHALPPSSGPAHGLPGIRSPAAARSSASPSPSTRSLSSGRSEPGTMVRVQRVLPSGPAARRPLPTVAVPPPPPPSGAGLSPWPAPRSVPGPPAPPGPLSSVIRSTNVVSVR